MTDPSTRTSFSSCFPFCEEVLQQWTPHMLACVWFHLHQLLPMKEVKKKREAGKKIFLWQVTLIRVQTWGYCAADGNEHPAEGASRTQHCPTFPLSLLFAAPSPYNHAFTLKSKAAVIAESHIFAKFPI